MDAITQVLNAIDRGDPQAAEQLLPLVYDELRRLAARKLAQELPGQTLQATALVHEAYLRLMGMPKATGDASAPRMAQSWDGRRHFFAAAAEAMRRILIEAARQKGCLKRGGHRECLDLNERDFAAPEKAQPLLDLDEALGKLAAANPQAAELIKLRYFAGCTNDEAASLLGVSPRKANQIWAYARAWLLEDLGSAEHG